MDEATFKRRTRDVALRMIDLIDSLPNSRATEVIGRQLSRSGTSIVEEEADETLYRLDLLVGSKKIEPGRVNTPRNQVHEIVAMTVASIKTLRSRALVNPKSKIQNPK